MAYRVEKHGFIDRSTMVNRAVTTILSSEVIMIPVLTDCRQENERKHDDFAIVALFLQVVRKVIKPGEYFVLEGCQPQNRGGTPVERTFQNAIAQMNASVVAR